RGSSSANLTLSQQRAQACVDYLVNEKGIPRARLVAKGWGEGKPLRLPDGTVLTDNYINSRKTVAEREALHQLNRRTTFQVLSNDYHDPNAKQAPAQKVEVKKGYFDNTGDEDDDDTDDSGGNAPQKP
ncbi:MAG TPA: OmpA family protein, partial [Bacteroidia bacterium]|nr:OmpA family protein [Bacteroidia bacterium]